MAMVKANNVYIENKVKTASPIELVILAYDGAISFLDNAKQYLEDKDFPQAKTAITNARQIVKELRNCLDMKVGGVAEHLFASYRIMDKSLLDAYVKKDKFILEQVKSMLVDLKEAWQTIAKNGPAVVNQPARPDQDCSYLNVYR